MKLTHKQKMFCDYYISSLNATESAIRAGYSKKTATEIGAENLRKPHIRLYIKEVMDVKDAQRVMNMDEILETQSRIARGEEEEEVIVTLYKSYEVVKKKPSLRDRQKSMEHLAKLHGFGESLSHTGSVVFKFESDYGDHEEDSI